MSGIDIKVNGKGQLNIGNLAQGQNVSITSGNVNLAKGDATLMELLEAVRELAGGDDAKIEAIQGKVQELSETMTAEPQNTGRIKDILGMIKEHHDWAFPAISAIVTKIIPTITALL